MKTCSLKTKGPGWKVKCFANGIFSIYIFSPDLQLVSCSILLRTHLGFKSVFLYRDTWDIKTKVKVMSRLKYHGNSSVKDVHLSWITVQEYFSYYFYIIYNCIYKVSALNLSETKNCCFNICILSYKVHLFYHNLVRANQNMEQMKLHGISTEPDTPLCC